MIESGWSAFDLTSGAILLLLALYGAWKGMTRLVLGFLGLAAGWILAVRWSESLAVRLGADSGDSGPGPDLYRMAAFCLIFLAVVVVSSLAAWPIRRFLGVVNLRGMDRLAGGGLGLLLAMLSISAATVPLLSLWPPDGGPLMRNSRLATYAVAGGDYLKTLAPEPMRSHFAERSRALFGGLEERQTRDAE